MWYVIYCTSGKEEIVRLEMEKLVSPEIYDSIKIITSKRKRKFKGQWQEVEKRLFPGYIFVVTEQPERLFASLKRVPKFTKLLGIEDKFIPISEQEEELLEKLLRKNSPFVVKKASRMDLFGKGDVLYWEMARRRTGKTVMAEGNVLCVTDEVLDDEVIDMSYGVIENDEVIVFDGPLKGMEGRISKIDRHKREAYVEVEFMGELRTMRLGLEIIEKR